MRQLGRGRQVGLIARHLLGVPVNASERSRLRAMRALVRLAYARTPFYRELYSGAGIHPDDIRSWADLQALPVTTKDDLLAAGEDCLVGGNRRSDLRSCSSGSSGKRLDVVQSPNFWIADSLIGVREFRRRFDYRRNDLTLYANTSAYPYTSIGGGYRFLYFDNLRPPRELYETLLAHRPSFLMACPSIAEELAAYAGHGLLAQLGLRALVTHSEQSTQSQRNALAQVFGCAVCDEYATEECGRLAVQCKFQTYHLIESGAHLEVLDTGTDTPVADGVLGEVTATCLLNQRMPIIRYRHGDLAAIQPATCPCGIRGRQLTALEGRANDAFSLPDGTSLTSGRLLDWTYGLLLDDWSDIRQLQLHQHATGDVDVTVVPGPGYHHDSCLLRIIKSFHELLSDKLTVNVRVVPELPGSRTGKRRSISRSVDRVVPKRLYERS